MARISKKSNYSDTNLSDVVLRRANLAKADLSGADLTGAGLSDADLSEASLWRKEGDYFSLLTGTYSSSWLRQNSETYRAIFDTVHLMIS